MATCNFYEFLNVHPSADAEVIAAAYRALMKKYHPDIVQNNPETLKRSKEITEAYRTLSDPNRRARYDASLKPSGPSPEQPAPWQKTKQASGFLVAWRVFWAAVAVTLKGIRALFGLFWLVVITVGIFMAVTHQNTSAPTAVSPPQAASATTSGQEASSTDPFQTTASKPIAWSSSAIGRQVFDEMKEGGMKEALEDVDQCFAKAVSHDTGAKGPIPCFVAYATAYQVWQGWVRNRKGEGLVVYDDFPDLSEDKFGERLGFITQDVYGTMDNTTKLSSPLVNKAESAFFRDLKQELDSQTEAASKDGTEAPLGKDLYRDTIYGKSS